MADLYLKTFTTYPPLKANLYENDGVTPIPGLSTADSVVVTLKGAKGGIITGTCTVTNPTTAEVTYQWEAGDTDVADTYQVEWLITWSAGVTQDVPNEAANNPTVEIDASLNGAAG